MRAPQFGQSAGRGSNVRIPQLDFPVAQRADSTSVSVLTLVFGGGLHFPRHDFAIVPRYGVPV
jgi:hypothetical protein